MCPGVFRGAGLLGVVLLSLLVVRGGFRGGGAEEMVPRRLAHCPALGGRVCAKGGGECVVRWAREESISEAGRGWAGFLEEVGASRGLEAHGRRLQGAELLGVWLCLPWGW